MRVGSWFKNIFKPFINGDKKEQIKIVLLSICFFLVIGGYTLVKELKDSIFLNIVGLEYLPKAKLISMFILIPLVFLYSRLVDILRRHQLLCLYSTIYALGGLICVYFIGHSTIGLPNTDTSPYRIFGWFFYFFLEGYSPFVVSVLWAFMNSVSSPESVKDNYIIMVMCSKFGGTISAGFAWWFFSMQIAGKINLSDVESYQVILILASFLILLVPLLILCLKRFVPESYLRGYEAVYKVEKKRSIEEKKISKKGGFFNVISGMFSGLTLLIRNPYALGIFGMIFFWEIINVIFNYLRLGIGQATIKSTAEFGVFLYQQACFTQGIGFIFVLFGTRTIVNWLGERKSLICVPLLIGTIVGYYLIVQTIFAAMLAYVLMRSVNYAFAYPLRESLYIPTTKDMKFKSKSWIDGFGSKVSKGVGSYYNLFIQGLSNASVLNIHLIFFGIIIGLWTVMAHFLGRRFESAVKNNEVIGIKKKV